MAPTASEKLVNYLEERILSGEYAPGSRIPSSRRLAVKFGLGNGTAMRAVDSLVERGLLENLPRRGFFVRAAPLLRENGNTRNLAVVMEPPVAGIQRNYGMYYTAFLGISRAAEAAGFRLTRLDAESILSTQLGLEKIIREASADGIIFLNEYDRKVKELRLDIPAVAIAFNSSFGGQISTVNINPYAAARGAVDYFAKRGFLKVRVITDPRPILKTRALVFRALWEDIGGHCEILNHDLCCGAPFVCDYAPEFGYFFTSDHTAQWIFEREMAEKNEFLPDRVTVLSVDGKRLINPQFFKFPTLAIDWLTVGKVAFDELCLRIADRSVPIKSIFLEPQLHL